MDLSAQVIQQDVGNRFLRVARSAVKTLQPGQTEVDLTPLPFRLHAMNAASITARPMPTLRVMVDVPACRTHEFSKTFRIGRTTECELCVPDDHVSRVHAEVTLESGAWYIRDLNSSNGIYVAGRRVSYLLIDGETAIRLGVYGPEVRFEVVRATPPEKTFSDDHEEVVARYIEHYFSNDGGKQPVGEHTMFVRQAFSKVHAKQKRKYVYVVFALLVCTLFAGGYALYEREQIKKERATAKELFYAMKALDVDLAGLQKTVMNSNDPASIAVFRRDQDRRKEMEKSYDQFLATLHVYNPKMTEQERLILRVARVFGECELDMPPDFEAEVTRYINLWKSSGRFERAVNTANQNGYVAPIAKEFLDHGLPPQFFYLAMQESNFDPYASGPLTRKGIAKGMWQFIPETAVKYGLQLGPMVDVRRPDPSDDRHHWDKETKAAADYIGDLYATDAQASGLLVMSCYNWGEVQVLPLIRSMPANPRDRNFWQLLSRYRDKIPQQTYDYVFYIVSAAVIGENPHLFGFHLDNPLVEARTSKKVGAPRWALSGRPRHYGVHRGSQRGVESVQASALIAGEDLGPTMAKSNARKQ